MFAHKFATATLQGRYEAVEAKVREPRLSNLDPADRDARRSRARAHIAQAKKLGREHRSLVQKLQKTAKWLNDKAQKTGMPLSVLEVKTLGSEERAVRLEQVRREYLAMRLHACEHSQSREEWLQMLDIDATFNALRGVGEHGSKELSTSLVAPVRRAFEGVVLLEAQVRELEEVISKHLEAATHVMDTAISHNEIGVHVEGLPAELARTIAEAQNREIAAELLGCESILVSSADDAAGTIAGQQEIARLWSHQSA